MKPHDAGPIWLYFLLAGGVQRKRALQTLSHRRDGSARDLVALACRAALAAGAPRKPADRHVAWRPRLPRAQHAGGRGIGMIISLQALQPLPRRSRASTIRSPTSFAASCSSSGVSKRCGWASRRGWPGSRSPPSRLSPCCPSITAPTTPGSCCSPFRPAPCSGRQRGRAAGVRSCSPRRHRAHRRPLLDRRSFSSPITQARPSTLGMIPAPLILLALGIFYLWIYLRPRSPRQRCSRS